MSFSHRPTRNTWPASSAARSGSRAARSGWCRSRDQRQSSRFGSGSMRRRPEGRFDMDTRGKQNNGSPKLQSEEILIDGWASILVHFGSAREKRAKRSARGADHFHFGGWKKLKNGRAGQIAA